MACARIIGGVKMRRTSGKSGTKNNPTGTPRGMSLWDADTLKRIKIHQMTNMRNIVRKYGMSKTQWRRLRHSQQGVKQ